MNVRVSSSPTPSAQPPRSNPFLRSSSDAPPFPCITPSTVIWVIVISFMGLSRYRRPAGSRTGVGKCANGCVTAGVVVADVTFDVELLRGEEFEVAGEKPFGQQEPRVYFGSADGVPDRLDL